MSVDLVVSSNSREDLSALQGIERSSVEWNRVRRDAVAGSLISATRDTFLVCDSRRSWVRFLACRGPRDLEKTRANGKDQMSIKRQAVALLDLLENLPRRKHS
jgi:hypothetical protein